MGVSGQLNVPMGKYAPVPFGEKARWATEPVWTLWNTKGRFPCRESDSGRPARSSSLFKDKFLLLYARPVPLPQKSAHEPLSESPIVLIVVLIC
jgi:hypothetical protein